MVVFHFPTIYLFCPPYWRFKHAVAIITKLVPLWSDCSNIIQINFNERPYLCTTVNVINVSSYAEKLLLEAKQRYLRLWACNCL